MISAWEYASELTLIELALTLSVAMAGLVVAFMAVCRLRFLHQRQHSAVWVWAYLLIAFGSAGMAIEVWSYEARAVHLFALSGAALWLWGSRMSWKEGAPKYLERKAEGG